MKGFTIYGRDRHLGHVISIKSSDFHFLVPESFHKRFGLDRHRAEKLRFEFLYVHDLVLRSRNNLDLQYSHAFIYAI